MEGLQNNGHHPKMKQMLGGFSTPKNSFSGDNVVVSSFNDGNLRGAAAQKPALPNTASNHTQRHSRARVMAAAQRDRSQLWHKAQDVFFRANCWEPAQRLSMNIL